MLSLLVLVSCKLLFHNDTIIYKKNSVETTNLISHLGDDQEVLHTKQKTKNRGVVNH